MVPRSCRVAVVFGGGVYNSASTILTKNNIHGNTCSGGTSMGAGIYSSKAVFFYNNIVSQNTATGESVYGGGICLQVINNNITSTITGNFIIGNVLNTTSVPAEGGGLYLNLGNAVITDNVISGNSCSAGYGGGVFTSSGTFTFNNNTFTNNFLGGSGLGGAFMSAGYVYQGIYNTTNLINNCIFWGNSARYLPDLCNNQTIMNVKNTVLQSSASLYTTPVNLLGLASPDKNIYATDPLFNNSSSLAGKDGIYGTNDDGLTLQNSSPAINAGNNYLVPADVTTDISGNPRIQNSTVDMGAYETPSTVLPLRLLNFNGNRQGNRDILQWTTSNEVSNKTFIVESSADGSSFLPIGNVAATGGGNYSFTDNNPIANRTYYRLKMMDMDGKFTYSNVIWINFTETTNISFYPNPVTQTATLNIGNNANLIRTQAKLTNANGRLFKLITIAHYQEQLDMVTLPPGLYVLKMKDGSIVKVMKQ